MFLMYEVDMKKALITILVLTLVAAVLIYFNRDAKRLAFNKVVKPILKEVKKKKDEELKINDPEAWHKKQLYKTHRMAAIYINLGTAIMRSKYNQQLAGDAPKAKRLRLGKINGNGNGKIEGGESLAYWEHLINGTGVNDFRPKAKATSIRDKSIIGINVPPSVEFRGIGYWAGYYNAYDYSGNAIVIGSESYNGRLDGAALTPADAKYLNKSVKGGSIYTLNGEGREDCIVNNQYNLQNKEKSCILVYWFDKKDTSAGAAVYYKK